MILKQAKRLLMVGLLCLLPGTALAAPIQIQFWHGMGGELNDITNELVKNFNASQNKYEVVPVYKGTYDQVMTAAIAAFRAKKAPHLVQIYEVGTASMMAAKGVIKPVHEIMAAAKTPIDPKMFLAPIAAYYSTPDGKLLSMPFNCSTTVLYYNKSAMKKAGLDPEKFPATWPEVAAVGKKMKDAGAVKFGMVSGWQSWVQLESFSTWHNVPFASKENGMAGLDAELLANSALHVKHIDFLSQQMKEGNMTYTGRKSEPINTFTNGEAGILMNSSGSYAAVTIGAKKTGFDWGVAMIPYWPDVKGAPQNTLIGGGTIWALSGHPKDEDAGIAAFFNFLLKPENQSNFHMVTGYLPLTMEGYELTKKNGFYEKNPGTDIGILSLTQKAPTPNSKGLRLGNMSQLRDVADEELEAVWSGKKDAKTALDAFVKRGNEILRRFEKVNK
ncbi:glycerol-3-phosphate transporter subunit; periplasmic-binding component of ABC superfamily [uncultured delta proteobacterium]|uniref:Glycerol-3-phosphate transporter subunit periplasmic-binding component of ABC superfamily n=1 Tax=uncultured delta proteobacterium TaxID=34034 RepID=A0A212K4N5_9DELT|nr:glycerol-3-phosphate transporter subunit; periplasmic-binding component of ABC superfamily [uncultured delta proteobacterium]